MSKDNINMNKSILTILKTLLIILGIALLMYAIMAIITHFSLNYEMENYTFSQSLNYIFNTKTAIFKFFIAFMVLNIVWVSIAISINFFKKINY